MGRGPDALHVGIDPSYRSVGRQPLRPLRSCHRLSTSPFDTGTRTWALANLLSKCSASVGKTLASDAENGDSGDDLPCRPAYTARWPVSSYSVARENHGPRVCRPGAADIRRARGPSSVSSWSQTGG